MMLLASGLCILTSHASAQDQSPPTVQQLIDRVLQQMIFVEGGSYLMGDPRQPFADILGNDAWKLYFPDENNVPIHKVTLDGFYMSAYETTYADYDIYTEATGQEMVSKKYLQPSYIRRAGVVRDPQMPAGVGWQGAHDYCSWLAEQTNLPFALPTEAQWEYAARNRGQTVVFATDNGTIAPGRNYTDDSNSYPECVGTYPSSPMGFYDLSGNAYEWVQDWYAENYYAHSPERNPQGPKAGTEKVYRGGG
jgi:formylglycine-generating enzyme required for sulfatase activity